MGLSPDRFPWWDREVDDSGSTIRTDVREAARRIWGRVRINVRGVLGDSSDAPELLERAVASVSRYLDKYSVPPHDPSGLLITAVRQLARRLDRRHRRELPIGGTNDLAKILEAPDLSDAVDRRIFLRQLMPALKERNRAILRLRIVGYDWEEIGEMLKVDPAAARKDFWRDVRRAYLRLLRPDQGDTSTAQKK